MFFLLFDKLFIGVKTKTCFDYCYYYHQQQQERGKKCCYWAQKSSLFLIVFVFCFFAFSSSNWKRLMAWDRMTCIFFFTFLYRTNFARSRTKNNSQLLFSKVILQYLVCVGKSTNSSSTLQKASLRLKSSLTLLQNYESILHNIYIWSSVSGVSECFKGPRVT